MNQGQFNNMTMEYQKIANLLNDASNQPSKFRTRNWIEINDESRGTYTGNKIKFKTKMLRSSLYGYTDVLLVQEMMMPQNDQMKETKVSYLKTMHHLLNA